MSTSKIGIPHEDTLRTKDTVLRPLVRSIFLKITLSRLNKTRDIPITYLKPKQVQCIISAAADKDVLGILPTGYGKSLIFEAIPIYQSLTQQRHSKTIVLSPLNVIIEQQMSILGEDAIRVQSDGLESFAEETRSIDSDTEADDACWSTQSFSQLKKGDFRFLLGHPEDILAKSVMDTMRNSKWASKVSTVVIDEAHCVVQWSTDFRPKYREIEHLRAIFPSATFIALTATASVRMRKDILRLLNMGSATIISAQNDRVNIKYSVQKRPSNAAGVETSYTSVFVPIMKELKKEGDKFPKTIIYTALKWCGFANEIGVRILSPGKLTLAGVPQIAQFHAPLSPEVKKAVADEMASQDADLKLLLATEAYGMGVDTPDVRHVIHAGPPCTLETYMQTTGRGGRDGGDCEATLFYNNEDLGKKIVTEEMRTFCRLETCRRKYLSEYFGTEPIFKGPLHRCCDNCELTCECKECYHDSCLGDNGPVLSVTTEGDVSHETIHNHSTELIIFDALQQVFDEINSDLGFQIDPALFSGLTLSLAKDVSAHYELFTSEDLLQMNYFRLSPKYINTIYQIISVCKTIPLDNPI